MRAKEVADAAVLEAVSSIASVTAAGKSGEPDDPGQTFDELYDWKRDEEGVPYWRKGPKIASGQNVAMILCMKISV